MDTQTLLYQTEQIKIQIDLDWILQSLADRYRWPVRYHNGQPSVEVILEDGRKTDALFQQDGYLHSDTVMNYFNEGYTILISRIQKMHPDIRKLGNIVDHYVNSEVNMNFYFGRGKKSTSFLPHNHDYPVLVKNVQGISEWLIGNKNYTLSNQGVLYFDAGTDHAVTKIIEPKFSITCNL
jgi:hypothetical protein